MTADPFTGRFAFSVVLYDSADLVPFGDKLTGVPLSPLWG